MLRTLTIASLLIVAVSWAKPTADTAIAMPQIKAPATGGLTELHAQPSKLTQLQVSDSLELFPAKTRLIRMKAKSKLVRLQPKSKLLRYPAKYAATETLPEPVKIFYPKTKGILRHLPQRELTQFISFLQKDSSDFLPNKPDARTFQRFSEAVEEETLSLLRAIYPQHSRFQIPPAPSENKLGI